MENVTNRILVPLDGSLEAEGILPALMPLVAHGPAELTLFRAVDRAEAVEPSQAYLTRIQKNLKEDGVASVTRLEYGRPVDEILHLAHPDRHRLIAMTTHGRSGLRRALMGSVAEATLRRAPLPVILNRPGTRIGDWKRIVVALDGSPLAEAILDEAAQLAFTLKATLHLLRVSLPLLPATDMFFTPEMSEAEDFQPYLEGICERIARKGVFAMSAQREGFAGDELVKYAREINAGLIAMVTAGRTGLSRMIAGSVAESVLRAAPCPVLIRHAATIAVPANLA
jgi:nucleotide-binding universal stress UspA family protein